LPLAPQGCDPPCGRAAFDFIAFRQWLRQMVNSQVVNFELP
jgi:hypothetical protein